MAYLFFGHINNIISKFAVIHPYKILKDPNCILCRNDQDPINLTYKRYSSGPRTDPWDTSLFFSHFLLV